MPQYVIHKNGTSRTVHSPNIPETNPGEAAYEIVPTSDGGSEKVLILKRRPPSKKEEEKMSETPVTEDSVSKPSMTVASAVRKVLRELVIARPALIAEKVNQEHRIGTPFASVRRTLSELVRQGRVRRNSNSEYRLLF